MKLDCRRKTWSKSFLCNCIIIRRCLVKNRKSPSICREYERNEKIYKTGVINDPLGHTHSLASSEHCFHLKFVLFYYNLKSERIACVKTMITIGRDCGTAEWINIFHAAGASGNLSSMLRTAKLAFFWPHSNWKSVLFWQKCFFGGFLTVDVFHRFFVVFEILLSS